MQKRATAFILLTLLGCGGAVPLLKDGGEDLTAPVAKQPAPQPETPVAESPDAGQDAATPAADASVEVFPDASTPVDSGVAEMPDAGAAPDASMEMPDAGVVDCNSPLSTVPCPHEDAGVPDAGVVDAGTPDAGVQPCTPGTKGCGCVYANSVWSCNPGTSVVQPVVCNMQTLQCSDCGYVGGPCCQDATTGARTCDGSGNSCLHHQFQEYKCHANFQCGGTGNGTSAKPCFEGGCCGTLTCNGTCG